MKAPRYNEFNCVQCKGMKKTLASRGYPVGWIKNQNGFLCCVCKNERWNEENENKQQPTITGR